MIGVANVHRCTLEDRLCGKYACFEGKKIRVLGQDVLTFRQVLRK